MMVRTTEYPPHRILFLRVGIDKGCGRALAPLFSDGSFEYVPIPESAEDAGALGVRFGDIPARSGGSVAQFVPKRFRDGYAHHDPEFETFTYGDPTRNKRSQLLRLSTNDLLIFYAGLEPKGFEGEDALYVIGYFTVKTVHEIPDGPVWPPPEFERLRNNAHLRRAVPDSGLVIVEGDRVGSRLLDRAAPLSDASRNVLPELVEVIGFGGSVKRAIGRWVPESQLSSTSEWLMGL